MKFYKLIEWSGKGSGETIATSYDKEYLLSLRERVYTAQEAKIKYGNLNYFFASDVPASYIVTYKSKRDYIKEREPLYVQSWY